LAGPFNSLNRHRYLHKIGADHDTNQIIQPSSLPPNPTVKSLVCGLVAAHAAYGSPKPNFATNTGVLFVVQPNNVNICDERPLEYSLWDQDPPIPAFRVEFGPDILTHTSLTDSRELLYHAPSSYFSTIEISVVYIRAGLNLEEYDDIGLEARLQLERSRAIKCPSILSHLSTFKKVQQALSEPVALERFISPESAVRIAKTFASLYPLDASEHGLRARKLALDPQAATHYVLKPSLEGGGHNMYRGDIPPFLKSIPESQWPSYILMELINLPDQHNILLSRQGLYTGPTISELGIFGACLWRRNSNGDGVEVMENFEAGFSFKTKRRDVDEMSVVKGFGCFDSPCLV
jgi:glutathione synthetase